MSTVPEISNTAPEQATRRLAPLWVPASGLFLVAALVYALTISHSDLSLDVWSANYGSWHVAVKGNPWLDGTHIPGLSGNPLYSEWVLHAANGHTVIGRTPGVIVASLPAYLLVHPAVFTTVPGGISAALLTAGSVTLMFLALSQYLTRRGALLAAAVFGFTTPVWSVAANGMWPHTVTLFGISGMAWAASRNRWWWAGIFGGVVLWGRLHAALIVAVFGLLVGVRRRSPALVARVGIASGAFLVLMMVWTRWMYGTWNPMASYDTGPFAHYAGTHRFDLPNQLGFWIAPDRGILFWTPVILLLLPALMRSWHDLPDWSRSLIWGGLAYNVLQGVLNRFSGGDVFYGYRLGLEMLACATPALALSAPRLGRVGRILVGPVLAIQLLAISVGALGDGHTLPVEDVWRRNAFATFLASSGVAGWVMVVLFAAGGWFVGRAWSTSYARDDEGSLTA